MEGIAKALSSPVLLGALDSLSKHLETDLKVVAKFVERLQQWRSVLESFNIISKQPEPKPRVDLAEKLGMTFLESQKTTTDKRGTGDSTKTIDDAKKVTETIAKSLDSLRSKIRDINAERLEIIAPPGDAIAAQVENQLAELREALGPELASRLPSSLAEKFKELFTTIADSGSQLELLKKWNEQMAETKTSADFLDAEFKDLQETMDRFSAQSISVETGKIKEALNVDLDVSRRTGGGLAEQITAIEGAIERLTRLGAETSFTATLTEQIRLLADELERLKLVLTGATDQKALLDRQIEDALEPMRSFRASVESIASGISNAFDQTLQGVLMGTQTWGQAMQNMMRNIAISIMSEIHKALILKPLEKILGTLAESFAFGLMGMGGGLSPSTTFTTGGSFAPVPFTAAKGGIVPQMTGPVYRFGSGGIVDRPMFSATAGGGGVLFGENAPRQYEAIVPLPDNRSIPARITGPAPELAFTQDVIVNNYGNEPVKQERRRMGDKEQLVLTIGDMVAKDLRTGRGPVSRALSDSYTVNRTPARR